LVAYFLSNISARNDPEQFMYVKVIARQGSDVF